MLSGRVESGTVLAIVACQEDSMSDQRKDAPEPIEREEPNEGEGNKTADRIYREGATEFIETHDVESLAEQARQDIERDPEPYEEAQRRSLEHIAEEDPEVSKPLEWQATSGPPEREVRYPEKEIGAEDAAVDESEPPASPTGERRIEKTPDDVDADLSREEQERKRKAA
jgi:hypothetical protein